MVVDYATRAMGFHVLLSRVGYAVWIIYECQPRCRWSSCGHHCPGLPDQHIRPTHRKNKLAAQDRAVLLRSSHRYTCQSSIDMVVSLGAGGCRSGFGYHWIGCVQQARFTCGVNSPDYELYAFYGYWNTHCAPSSKVSC